LTFLPIPASPPLAAKALEIATQAPWTVLVSCGGAALAHELIKIGRPLLVVESDPEQVEELKDQRLVESTSLLTVCCELLGDQAGEACWYRYNDPRQNGTAQPDTTRSRFPNLQLLSLELRPLRKLDDVLTAWERRIASGSQCNLQGLGALVATGIQTIPLLEGGSQWLERFSYLLLPRPTLNTNEENEEWMSILGHHYLAEEVSSAESAAYRGFIQLKKEREKLLEFKLNLAREQIRSLTEERETMLCQQGSISADKAALDIQHHELSAQRDSLVEELEAARAELNGIIAHNRDIATQLKVLETEHLALCTAFEAVQAQNRQLTSRVEEHEIDRQALAKEIGRLKSEREDLMHRAEHQKNILDKINAGLDSILRIIALSSSSSC
jgi:hypothetical protein